MRDVALHVQVVSVDATADAVTTAGEPVVAVHALVADASAAVVLVVRSAAAATLLVPGTWLAITGAAVCITSQRTLAPH
ncbi:uncharacterized protein AMSG_08630 [Thecamonas trahens ATCC 50062]|uniref:Uncharacterized protein n=1 Tax=Thecamonas trahens ATCC 50062 TaxID=461836 RepID=A0A0L0DMV5_THETB|nr:hypothetical protein AMSG_08630 [Thecamonas trahens ATCC 50062]KNC52748.1 hypothetical protein AMSG_08630 [Thecamonas trahens ATCC 50062]|eukprot:XP_013755061.1 hypothetical protein AMSG_08630 [Thecamonas trahens ATCC 50062]